ncbi:hypothetical protein CROQUDRAFT_674614 [Cronartium quercuum f. sp. fusiforme G11]|uniref:Uncharacterized protein n=1 Tax=Cronartium quercuum f. sp. fusiforme G11 TaxID=708437 RepID=A0A9P6N7M9_9BASI|nr:hypothetical protein CROQUDRAFT_674614 [Cronartium quercuum f. sp. fusiforme G11]
MSRLQSVILFTTYFYSLVPSPLPVQGAPSESVRNVPAKISRRNYAPDISGASIEVHNGARKWNVNAPTAQTVENESGRLSRPIPLTRRQGSTLTRQYGSSSSNNFVNPGDLSATPLKNLHNQPQPERAYDANPEQTRQTRDTSGGDIRGDEGQVNTIPGANWDDALHASQRSFINTEQPLQTLRVLVNGAPPDQHSTISNENPGLRSNIGQGNENTVEFNGFNGQPGLSRQNTASNVIEFSNPVEVSGGNSRTVIQYTDGLNIDTISTNPHTLNVELNQQPPSTDFVTPLDPSRRPVGGPWVPLTGYSYVMSFENSNPDDLIMRIQVPYNQDQLNARGVSDSNVYLALYEPMRGGWVIDVDRSENRRDARITEINAIAAPRGEYILLARQTSESNDESNSFLRFGTSPQNLFNVLPPPPGSNMPPLQIGSWQDGSKVLIRSSGPMQIQMSIGNLSEQAIPNGFRAASRYACLIDSTSSSNQVTVITHLQMPYVPTQLSQRNIEPAGLMVLGRPLNSGGSYQVLSSTSLTGSDVLMNTPMTMSSGEFILAAPENSIGQPMIPQVSPVAGGTLGQNRQAAIPTEASLSKGMTEFAPVSPLIASGTSVSISPPPVRTIADQLSAGSSIQPNTLPPIQQIGGTSTRISDLQNAQIRAQTNNALAQSAFGSSNVNVGTSRAFNIDPSFGNGEQGNFQVGSTSVSPVSPIAINPVMMLPVGSSAGQAGDLGFPSAIKFGQRIRRWE